MSDDSYNGWSNRETWAVNLHLSNDEGLYRMTLAAIEAYDNPCEVPGREAGEAIRELLDELFSEYAEDSNVRMMRDEIGSLWRVDWDEVGRAWLEVSE